jgi:voltage-gated potassium channel
MADQPSRNPFRRKTLLADQFRPLRRQVKLPVWGDLGLRLGLAFLLIAFVVAIHWWDRAGLKDGHDGVISFLDVVYFTMISITTTGFGDIAPISDRSRLIEAVIVTPVRIAVLFIFVGAAYDFVIKRSWEKFRMARIQEQLSGHVVVLGYGVSGSQSVGELIARGVDPRCIVVIDPSEERLAEAEKLGVNVMAGDATRDENLKAVRIAEAQSVLVSAGRDDTSILIVLTVRHLAPRVPISVVVRAEDNELLARQAGANNVINPVRFTGLLLAGSVKGAHIAEYLADLASVGGRVQLVERVVAPEECGKSIEDLKSGGQGLRVYRGGRAIGFWEDECQSLQPGDVVVEIVPTAGSEGAVSSE